MLIAVLLCAGCGDGGSGELAVERRAIDGREQVLNRGPDRPLTWSADSLFTVGGADAGPESFFRIEEGWAAGDEDGNLFVLDRAGFRVVGFDSTGTHFLTVGVEGEGPGELRLPMTVLVEGDGQVSVVDQGKQTLEQWEQTGEFAGSQRMSIPGQVWMVKSTPQGWLHHRAEFGQDRVRYTLVLQADEEIELAVTDAAEARRIRFEECGLTIAMPPMFTPELVWDAAGPRAAVSVQPEYRVDIWDGSSPSMQVVREVEPRRAGESDGIRELGDEVTIGTPDCRISSAEVVAQRGTAELVPAVRRVRVDPAGGLWVERYEPGVRPGPIDVFDSSGRYQGTLPEDFPWPAVFLSEERIAAVQVDALEVQRLVVYQLRRP